MILNFCKIYLTVSGTIRYSATCIPSVSYHLDPTVCTDVCRGQQKLSPGLDLHRRHLQNRTWLGCSVHSLIQPAYKTKVIIVVVIIKLDNCCDYHPHHHHFQQQHCQSINQSINQTSIAPICPAKPGSVAPS